MLPAVLLLSVGLGVGGLAILPQESTAPVTVTAAAASAPLVLDEPRTIVSNRRDLSLMDAPVVAKVPPRAPARASRTRRVAVRTPEFVRPGMGRITSGYTWRWGRMHSGVDLAAPTGSPVMSVGAGRVLSAGWEGAYGLMVKVELADGTITMYAHNSKLLVQAGETVRPGQLIAKVGNTGRSTGPHVHFEVRIGDRAVNPIMWLAARGVRL